MTVTVKDQQHIAHIVINILTKFQNFQGLSRMHENHVIHWA